MDKLLLIIAVLTVGVADASWYWPFGGGAKESPRRVSELMEPASLLIDEAADLAGDGKVDEAVEKYRAALDELARVELENPERADSPEFATLRNKRAYVNAHIDSLLLSQARKNAKAVAVTDTTELEQEFARRKAEAREAKSGRRPGKINDETRFVAEGLKELERGEMPQDEARQADPAAPAVPRAGTRKERLQAAMAALGRKDYTSSLLIIRQLLAEKPNDAAALNLRASVEAALGNAGAAEKTLDQCIQSNPRSYYAYYNMAKLIRQNRGEAGMAAARAYYERGRALGGPKDDRFEEAAQ